MLVLGIETSSPVASVAIVSAEGVKSEITLNAGFTHAEQLLPLIDDSLRQTKILRSDIEGIAVSGGPGSFTGLRIGMATAKGLAHALQLPLVSVPTLKALAFNCAHTQELCSPMMNARKNEIYTALFRWSDNILEQLHEDCAISAFKWAEKLKEYAQPVLLVGDGAWMNSEIWEKIIPQKGMIVPRISSITRAAAVAWLGREKLLSGEKGSLDQVKPVYIRIPEAEARLMRCKKD